MTMRNDLACLAGVALALAACDSTRALTATPAETPWLAGSYLKVALRMARDAAPPVPAIPLTLYVEASDSADARDALPPDIASASAVAVLVGTTALPLTPGVGFPTSATDSRKVPVMVAFPAATTLLPLMPRSDGTQEYRFLVKQRTIRTFVATVSVIP
ncbi:MAG: hypothetical protein FJZ01_12805 [Candidatus Sericytochromatia bacterium]|nr:hypothetical protein [Candidatus Tanganyikabacteria bacterium]